MLNRNFTYGILLAFFVSEASAQNSDIQISIQEAISLVGSRNKSIKVAEKEVTWAKNERQRLNAFWYPQVTAAGAYVHMSNKIEVKQSLSQFTDPAIDLIHSVKPSEEIISSVLANIGRASFSVPLFPQNTTSIDAVVTLPVFTGGKRIYAGKIGKLMVDIADVNRDRVTADQLTLLVDAYYALRLGQKVVEVRRETYSALERHYQNSLKLEKNGLINKAERLYFQVNRDEAKRELSTAIKDLIIVQNTFKTLVNMESKENVLPTSSLFINESLPDITHFKSLIAGNNYLVNGVKIQNEIQGNQQKIAQSAYLPNIELFGKQNLYSNGIPKNLAPRTMIGVGFSWNIFDGLDREKKISQAKINRHILDIQKDKLIDDMTLAVDKFYNQTQIALDNVTALKTTIEMSKELVRTRQKAYSEGMATSIEVVDAELLLSKVRIAALLAYFQFDSGLINLLSICGMPESFYQYSVNGKDETYF